MERGLIHLYWGEGKGKTTAAMGLALRAYGAGKKVIVVQFLKSGESGEIDALRNLGVEIYRGKGVRKFTAQMTQEEKRTVRERQTAQLETAMERGADVLILDEACGALEKELVAEETLRRAVLDKPAAQEVILTGRRAAQWMMDAADYNTEMVCHAHPYHLGVKARRGVEY